MDDVRLRFFMAGVKLEWQVLPCYSFEHGSDGLLSSAGSVARGV